MQEFILNLSKMLPGFLMAIVFHEAAHAYVAFRFGDPTAKMAGRLTLNPAVHLDILGTVIFPLIGIAIGGVMYGWAKPVPINGRNFKNYRQAIFWVSFAGPGVNVILGVISAFLFALILAIFPSVPLAGPLLEMLKFSVLINFILAVFNLIPFPPLDGSKMVASFLNYEQARRYEDLARYGFIFFIILIFTNVLRYVLAPAIWFGEFLMQTFYQLMN